MKPLLKIFVFAGIGLLAPGARAETVLYALDNVTLTNSTPMEGIFSWTYDVGGFASGVGRFVSLDIPWTRHNESNLSANIDVTESIEITFTNNVHDDGVDIMLVLARPLTPATSSPLVLGAGESKYEIGGNGFHTGLIASGSIVPTNLTLRIVHDPPGVAKISWEPEFPGIVLLETPNLSSNWTGSASGGTNPAVVPMIGTSMFFRAVKP